ncbi:MAG: hypothetical protein JO301_05910 [Chitinophagaceae bacterium]|nr:hypothetical protein [Chitinophagaceae bacterium]
MKNIIILFFATAAVSCSPKPTPADTEKRLKRAMSEFLYRAVGNDSSKVKFRVKDVAYFADKEFYECEFHVQMIQPGLDTTSLMQARIASDFSKVVRMR